MSIEFEDLNLLIFNYLKESGFRHSAFTFFRESVCSSRHRTTAVRPSMLVKVVKKGLQYLKIEAHINDDGEEMPCSKAFRLIGKHHCGSSKREKRLFHDSDSVKAIVQAPEKKIFTPQFDKRKDLTAAGALRSKLLERQLVKCSRDRPYKVTKEENAIVLLGHCSEVFVCEWNPMFQSQLATGSNDGGGRVWALPSSRSSCVSSNYLHCEPESNDKEIVTMDWHPRGTVLALGSYDGTVAQYTHDGWLRFKVHTHEAPVLSVKYNHQGNLILSGGMDGTARLLCTSVGNLLHIFRWHKGPVVNVDWKDESIFATCSVDAMIYIGCVKSYNPVCSFSGHKAAINALKWDPQGRILASCSDDTTVKIWAQNSPHPLRDLHGHQESVSCIQWAQNPDKACLAPILASASDDKTVCIWDVETGSLLYRLAEHSVRISSITFSPDGEYLASGAFDSVVHVFSTKTGKLVRSFHRPGEVFDVKWSPGGNFLAACFADNSVSQFASHLLTNPGCSFCC
ncbi:Transducin beta-like, variant 2 [Entomophthora muscae]|uniref:Transducin beta-like, variant 2 n=1 Tax=Entomophthora muscae TaxID=34485 RepID=A0ACC2SVW7_9FUNG|nr:Transducin beta-like, variant 2 [Entomophthora muscae]